MFPATGKYLKDVKIKIGSNSPIDVYIRKYVSNNLQISLAGSGVVYSLVTINPVFEIGSKYVDNNYADIELTVMDFYENVVIMSPSKTFETMGNIDGVLTEIGGEGSERVTYNKCNTSPGSAYFEKALSKMGEWVKLSYNTFRDAYFLSSLLTMLDYDRADILIMSQENDSFSINDIDVKFIATQRKNKRRTSKSKLLGYNESNEKIQMLTKTTFENALSDWNLSNQNATLWDGLTSLGSHIPSYFTSKGVTKILRLDKGDSVHQKLPGLGAAYTVKKYLLKLVARFYPTEAVNVDNLPSDIRTSDTFDFARIEVCISLGNNQSYYSKEIYVPLNFVEIEQEFVFDYYDGGTNELKITALDERVELLMCELYS